MAVGTKEVSPGGTSSTAMTPFMTHMACPSHSEDSRNARCCVILGCGWVGMCATTTTLRTHPPSEMCSIDTLGGHDPGPLPSCTPFRKWDSGHGPGWGGPWTDTPSMPGRVGTLAQPKAFPTSLTLAGHPPPATLCPPLALREYSVGKMWTQGTQTSEQRWDGPEAPGLLGIKLGSETAPALPPLAGRQRPPGPDVASLPPPPSLSPSCRVILPLTLTLTLPVPAPPVMSSVLSRHTSGHGETGTYWPAARLSSWHLCDTAAARHHLALDLPRPRGTSAGSPPRRTRGDPDSDGPALPLTPHPPQCLARGGATHCPAAPWGSWSQAARSCPSPPLIP